MLNFTIKNLTNSDLYCMSFLKSQDSKSIKIN